MIRYLTHNEIDKTQWDRCIAQAVNGLPYAWSWWLDVVSPYWEALILDDYQAVMPLTKKRKLGLEYLYQPYFAQQLGVFSPMAVNADQTNLFLDAIPAKFKYINIQLNAFNHPGNNEFRMHVRANYMLDLTPDYMQLSATFHRNCRRNIQKAVHAGLSVRPGPGPAAFSSFIEKNLERRITETPRNIYTLLQKITQASLQRKCGEILGVYDPGHRLAAAGWFIHTPQKCFFMVCASDAAGRKNQAMYLLVDHKIRERAGSGLQLDFTGSNMPGVAYFNSGFGAVKSTYPAVKRNRLPWWVRWLKR